MENMNHSDNGTVVAKKNKKVSILAFAGCFLLAFVIWIYVMNVKINDNTKTFNIKMDIKGENELLDDANFSVFGATETWVKVTVQGTNSDLNKCSEKDFGVYVDVSGIENAGRTPLNIVVESKSSAVSVVSTDPVQVSLFIDEKISSPVAIRSAPGESSSEESVGVNTEIIFVEGPRTYISEISYAMIFAENSESGDVLGNSLKVVFYDELNNVVESPYLVCDLTNVEVVSNAQ